MFMNLKSSIYPNPTVVLNSRIHITPLSLSVIALIPQCDTYTTYTTHTPLRNAEDVLLMDYRVFRHVCHSKRVSLKPKSSIVLRTHLRAVRKRQQIV